MPASLGHLTPFRAPCARLVAASAAYPPAGTNPNRRSALLAPALLAGLASSGAASVALPPPARADAPELVPFLGMDKPPTSYGGYGGTDPNELPKYTFSYPSGRARAPGGMGRWEGGGAGREGVQGGRGRWEGGGATVVDIPTAAAAPSSAASCFPPPPLPPPPPP